MADTELKTSTLNSVLALEGGGLWQLVGYTSYQVLNKTNGDDLPPSWSRG